MADIKVEKLGGNEPEASGAVNHKRILFAKLDWFASLDAPKPLYDADTPANEGTTFAELGSITGTHTFKTGYGFMTLEGVQESTGIESAGIGEKKNRSFENKTDVVLAGSSDVLVGFSRWSKNADVIVLLEEHATGILRQIGSERFAASITEFAGKLDPTVEGGSSKTFSISDKQVYEAPVYKGTVTVMPAQV